ncbi:MAG: UDP-N-acetylglucosamine 2-epimerase (non-hydrolyzing), partial [Clostridia bacterium]|nr:UDP-N-acetylglucosamine 2-epimerase (non-hydrolyzing) [Clostridia bacterium]
TEHIETVKQGTNILAGEDPERIRQALSDIFNGKCKAASIPEHWDGRTAERILRTLLETADTR